MENFTVSLKEETQLYALMAWNNYSVGHIQSFRTPTFVRIYSSTRSRSKVNIIPYFLLNHTFDILHSFRIFGHSLLMLNQCAARRSRSCSIINIMPYFQFKS